MRTWAVVGERGGPQEERELEDAPEDLRIRLTLAAIYSWQGRRDDTVRELETAMRHPSVH